MRELLLPAVEPRSESEPYVRAYHVLRTAIGLLGVALPVLLVFGEPILFDGQPFPRGSLSAYYYSGARELFVGSLFAVGFFQLTYKLADHSWENVLSMLAGVAVITVALFPTGKPGDRVPTTPLQDLLSETTVERIHFVAAAIFIASLAVISYFFSRPPPEHVDAPEGKLSPRFWRRYHLTCSGLIVVALALAAVAGITSSPDKGLLYAEVIATFAFGASWLAKGLDVRALFGKKREAAKAPEAPSVAPNAPS